QRCARREDVGRVAGVEVLDQPGRQLVGAGGAARAALVPLGMEHEVVDDQLRPAVEQLAQRPPAARALELVGLGDLDHRELAALGVEPVALAGEVLLLLEQLAASGVPLLLRDDLRQAHGILLRRPFAHSSDLPEACDSSLPGRRIACGAVPTIVPLCLGWMANDASALITGASGPMRYPVPGYAVIHERGTVVFDTGLHDTLMSSNEELGGLAKVFTIEQTPDDLVESRLAACGVEVAAVTHVVNSHLHFDHCGRNGPLAHATTLVQRAEWEAAQRPGRTTYVGVHLDEIGGGHMELVDG